MHSNDYNLSKGWNIQYMGINLSADVFIRSRGRSLPFKLYTTYMLQLLKHQYIVNGKFTS